MQRGNVQKGVFLAGMDGIFSDQLENNLFLLFFLLGDLLANYIRGKLSDRL